MAESFPRTTDIPTQSPLFWVTHKDRYLRQLLIRDIQQKTGRCLIVYFADCTEEKSQIDASDDIYLAELLSSCRGKAVDLLVETNGGATDATEKICSLLRTGAPDLRVIVPRRAKSNGTVIAMCGQQIVMGFESELGPIDPSFNGIPVEFVLNAPAGTINPIELQIADTFQKQTRKLASHLLTTGMMKGKDPKDIEAVVSKIGSRNHYHSHGSVIDSTEALALGLAVVAMPTEDTLWQLIGLLRAMYQFDCQQQRYLKIFEGDKVSLVVTAKPTT